MNETKTISAEQAALAERVAALMTRWRAASNGTVQEQREMAPVDMALHSIAQRLTKKVCAFGSFDELLAAWNHQYRPSLWRGDFEASLLADLYDFFQETRGVEVKAYRSGPETVFVPPTDPTAPKKPAPHVARVGDRVNFPRGMFGTWKGRITKLYIGRASRDRVANQGIPMAEVQYTKKCGGHGTKRIEVARLVDLSTMTKYQEA